LALLLATFLLQFRVAKSGEKSILRQRSGKIFFNDFVNIRKSSVCKNICTLVGSTMEENQRNSKKLVFLFLLLKISVLQAFSRFKRFQTISTKTRFCGKIAFL